MLLRISIAIALLSSALLGQYDNASRLRGNPPCSATITTNCVVVVNGSGTVVPPVASGGGATVPSVANVLKGDGAGNASDTKVAITSPTTAATIAFSGDNETVTLPDGTLATNTLSNIGTLVHDLIFTDATYDIGKSGATR